MCHAAYSQNSRWALITTYYSQKRHKKLSFLPDDTFFISSTKQRPTDNSWLSPASFKAGAVT